MEFPDPPALGRHERSIAERHRMLALIVAVASLLPVGVVAAVFIAHPLARLLASFLVAYGLLYLVVRFMRRRYLLLLGTQACVVRPTDRPPRRAEARVGHELSRHGFAHIATVAICSEGGTVLTRPVLVMQRQTDGLVVDVSSVGVMASTLLNDGTWLRTTASASIVSDRFRTQRIDDKAPMAIIAAHDLELHRLAAAHVCAVPQPPPLDVLTLTEGIERETLMAFQKSGVISPSAKALTATPAP